MKIWLIVGAILAGVAVLIGALGAHGLKAKVSHEDLEIFNTGVRYHLFHALAILLMGVIGFHLPNEIVSASAYLMTAGIVIFSGSLYLLVITNIRWLGAITPIGGLCLVIAWFLFAYKIYQS